MVFNHSKLDKNNEHLKTIAVLPFEDIDKSENNNSIAAGLTEEMISLLSSNDQLKIIPVPAFTGEILILNYQA